MIKFCLAVPALNCLLLAGVTPVKTTTPPTVEPPSVAASASTQSANTSEMSPEIQELLMVKPTPYDTKMQRDPFAAPSDADMVKPGEFVDDIGVMGRVTFNGQVYAVVSDSRGKIRWLPVGYKLTDGELVEIGDKAVKFHQWDVNAGTHSVYRTIVRTFKREEGKR